MGYDDACLFHLLGYICVVSVLCEPQHRWGRQQLRRGNVGGGTTAYRQSDYHTIAWAAICADNNVPSFSTWKLIADFAIVKEGANYLAVFLTETDVRSYAWVEQSEAGNGEGSVAPVPRGALFGVKKNGHGDDHRRGYGTGERGAGAITAVVGGACRRRGANHPLCWPRHCLHSRAQNTSRETIHHVPNSFTTADPQRPWSHDIFGPPFYRLLSLMRRHLHRLRPTVHRRGPR